MVIRTHPIGHGPTDDDRPLGEGEAEDLLRCICFKTGPPRDGRCRTRMAHSRP